VKDLPVVVAGADGAEFQFEAFVWVWGWLFAWFLRLAV
jgi:hypothetical protein